MKNQADKHRREHKFETGNMVMLSPRNLKLPAALSHKLSPKWIGPYKILRQIHHNSFELDLPKTFKIHPVFHASLLKPYQTNDNEEFPNCYQEPPPPVVIDDEEEFEAEKIIDECTYYGKKQYLVKWKGYTMENSTWEPEAHLKNSPDLVKDFQDHAMPRQIQMISINSHDDSR
jgi:hypothetical protein